MNLVETIWSIPFLIQLYADKYYQDDLSKTMMELANDFNVPKIIEFDFIIVGGGTAGCVLAGRLSKEYPLGRILLLEAGGTPPPATTVPHFSSTVKVAEKINTFFHSAQMKNAALGKNGIVTNHGGKMLGGSGSHNEMVHNRGSPKDYDNWAEIIKDDSWNYSNVLHYFRKSENFIGKQFGNDNSSEFYGRSGPITVDSKDDPILPLWFEAGKELGYDIVDPNGFQRQGFTPINRAIHNGRRVSSFSEYVEKWENDPLNTGHLTVIRYANVSQILLNNDNRAYGVSYTRHGFPQIAHAAKEVIVSAGALSSPLLLMKSGIGPETTLKKAGIPVKVPIKSIGQRITDHPGVTLTFNIDNASFLPRYKMDELETVIDDYKNHRRGLLANVLEGAQCYVSTSKADKDWPNVAIEMIPLLGKDDESRILEFHLMLGRPKSHGVFTMNTRAYRNGIRDDVQLALYDPMFLTDPDDVDVDEMLEGIKFVFKISENTTAFQKLNTRYEGYPADACKAFQFRSDEYWKCYIHQNTASREHMTGTLRMGPDSDTSDISVVDSKFRVRGVQNLRVVDASIIPVITNSNINAPVIMIAEKAADEIRKAWQPAEGNGEIKYGS